MKTTIYDELVIDLADNFKSDDDELLKTLIEDVCNDALVVSNRQYESDEDSQLKILKSDIKRAVKSIYLQRGAEDVTSQTQSGLSNTYDNAIETLAKNIIRGNKRLFI